LIAWGLGAAGLGFSMASMFPSMLVYAGQRMALSGQLNSWFFVGAGAGVMIVPWLIGQLFEPIGPQVTMWIILFDLFAIGLLFAAIRLYNQKSANKLPS
jgi:fucose permease